MNITETLNNSKINGLQLGLEDKLYEVTAVAAMGKYAGYVLGLRSDEGKFSGHVVSYAIASDIAKNAVSLPKDIT